VAAIPESLTYKHDSRQQGEPDRILVTAADSFFFESLMNLVGSLHTWEPDLEILVFDLGLSMAQQNQVKTWCHTTLRRFDWKRYPRHVHPQYRNYGWKAALILEVVKEKPRSLVFYEDAGQEIRGHLDPIFAAIQRDGYFFTTSGWEFPASKWNHHSAWRFWGLDPEEKASLFTRKEVSSTEHHERIELKPDSDLILT